MAPRHATLVCKVCPFLLSLSVLPLLSSLVSLCAAVAGEVVGRAVLPGAPCEPPQPDPHGCATTEFSRSQGGVQGSGGKRGVGGGVGGAVLPQALRCRGLAVSLLLCHS